MAARQVVERVSRASFRHRRAIVVIGLLIETSAVAWTVLRPDRESAGYASLVVIACAALTAGVVVANVLNRRRPRTFDVDAGAFATPRLGSGLLIALSCWALCAIGIAAALRGVRNGDWLWTLVIPVALGAGATLARLAWRGYGVRLTPEAVAADRTFSSIVVPWEAFDPERPPIADPDGFSLSLGQEVVQSEGVDTKFVAETLQHYVTHPEHRPAIGTPGELERLHTELNGTPAPVVRWSPPPSPAPNLTRGGVALRTMALVPVAAVALWDGTPYWLQLICVVAAAPIVATLWSHTRSLLKR